MSEAPRREEFRQFIELDVRWGDMDSLGHVNNARFFTYDESARIAYFDPLRERLPGFWCDCGIILARIGCDFLAQVRYPARLAIGTRIERLGRSSLTTRAGVFDGERCVAAVAGTLVWFDYVNQKSLTIPEDVRAWVRSREVVPPIE